MKYQNLNQMPSLFDQNGYQPKNKSVLRLINDFESNYHDIFKKVHKEWLPNIREFLREETGLRIHQKVVGTKIQKDTNVSFHFVTDRDETFLKLIDEHYPNLDFDEYTVFRRLNFQLKNSEKYFLQKNEKVALPYKQMCLHLDLYFVKYDLKGLINTLFKNSGKSVDIWGTYSLKGSKIEIYYIPLILFCQINSLPLEHAVLSTLVHEMAHAYHHIGKDKDNVTWPDMFITDHRIVEGMAEYFTWLFVETFKASHPGMGKTYDRMFECLGEEYTIFKTWTPTYSKEAIKSALLSTRKKGIIGYSDFEKLLADVKRVMH